jgi:hypothetical protein
MKPRVKVWLYGLVAVVLLASSAWADWGTKYKSLGVDPTVGDASCVQFNGNVVCAMRSQQHTMMVNQYSAGAWTGWTSVPGVITSDPSCANDKNGHLMCGVTDVNSSLGVLVYDGSTWSSFQDSGTKISLTPSCSFYRSGKVLCSARAVNGSLTGSVYDGTAWGKFISAKGTLIGSPGCASDDDRDVICLMMGLDANGLENMLVNRFIGSKWEAFLTLNGNGVDGATCVSMDAKGQVDCFIRAINTVVYVNHFKSGTWTTSNWTGWLALTGNAGAKTGCGVLAAGSLACGWIDIDKGLLYTRVFDGTNWGSYTLVGTKPSIGGPECSAVSNGKVICVVTGANTQAQSVTGP